MAYSPSDHFFLCFWFPSADLSPKGAGVGPAQLVGLPHQEASKYPVEDVPLLFKTGNKEDEAEEPKVLVFLFCFLKGFLSPEGGRSPVPSVWHLPSTLNLEVEVCCGN